MRMEFIARVGRVVGVTVAAAVVAACGGGETAGIDACDVSSQKTWLRTYMADRYYWSGASPDPEPAGYASVQAYFDALRYPGDALTPGDRWSYLSDSAAFNQFFSEGRTLGYGIFVNGLEGVLPLKLRYIEPASPAAVAGLKRGDTIVSVNGRSAADLMAAHDFSAFSPAREGDTLVMVLADGAGTRTVTLTAATHDLTPVSVASVLTLPSGTRAGYLVLKDFITQAEGPLAAAFAQFRAAGATELIIDLRYNGGGRVSTSNVLASLVAGASRSGEVFTRLRFNAKHRASDTVYRLDGAPGPAFSRVVVLTGPRTCSASELVVNGLKPYANVVTIGGATCGKPFGFNPTESCATTFSAVNFESFNGLDQGRYYAGIGATCDVSDDFSRELGDPAEKLTAAASSYLQTGVCPVVSTDRAHPQSASRRAPLRAEPGEWRGMWAD
jgi:carboxyl-terminal processing protease